jgi:2,5-dihydroxypyridine 5,6-dioxygenase
MSDPGAAGLVSLFRRELELCRVTPTEHAIVLADPSSAQNYVAASMAALNELGAAALHLALPELPLSEFTPADGGAGGFGRLRLAIDAMRAADLVVDLTGGGMLYTAALKTVLEASTRVLRIRGGVGALRRLFPCEEVIRRGRAGAAALERAQRIRVVSEAGTDLVMDKTGRPAMAQYGIAEAPGRWDNWGTGAVLSTALEDSAEGVLVIAEGDVVLPFRRYTAAPARCHFERGRIVAIEGGLDADLLREYFASWNDDRVTRPSHIGWGVEHRARWEGLAVNDPADLTADARFFYGNVQIAVGRNYGIGGSINCLPHTDIVLRHCDFYLDGEQIVADGQIVPAELR